MPQNATNPLSSFLHSIQFNILTSFLAAFPTQLNAFTTSLSHLIPTQFTNSFNQTIALTIPILTNLLQLKKNTPFSTHPTTMRVAVFTTILFYAAYTALLRFPLRRRLAIIADQCLLSIGNASVASLSSVLLPDSYCPFVFAVFGLLSVAELLYWLYDELIKEDDNDNDDDEEFDARRMRVSEFFNNVWAAFTNITGQPQPILPL